MIVIDTTTLEPPPTLLERATTIQAQAADHPEMAEDVAAVTEAVTTVEQAQQHVAVRSTARDDLTNAGLLWTAPAVGTAQARLAAAERAAAEATGIAETAVMAAAARLILLRGTTRQ